MAKSKQHPSVRVKRSTVGLRNHRQKRALAERWRRAHQDAHELCSTSIAQLAVVRDALVKGVHELNGIIEVHQVALELADRRRFEAEQAVSVFDAGVVAAGFPSLNEAPDPLVETDFEAKEEAERELRGVLRKREG